MKLQTIMNYWWSSLLYCCTELHYIVLTLFHPNDWGMLFHCWNTLRHCYSTFSLFQSLYHILYVAVILFATINGFNCHTSFFFPVEVLLYEVTTIYSDEGGRILFFYHSFILQRLDSRTRLILTPYDGWRRWDASLHTPACESQSLPLSYGCRESLQHAL